ncbi:MAG: leucine-rich repeat protein, partial [Candidatus Ornithomonoglobus sp.]
SAEGDGEVTFFEVGTPQPTPAIEYRTENGIKFYCEDYNDGVKMNIQDTPKGDVIIPDEIDGKTVLAVKFLVRGGAADAIQFESVYFPDTVECVEHMCDNKLLKSVHLPSSLTEIDTHLFDQCTALEYVEVPGKITNISPYAFNDCTSLKSVKLPEGLISIGERAFHASGLESIQIPSTVVKIDNNAFHVCRSLKSANIPEGVTYIGDSAFAQTAISTVTIPAGIEYIGSYAFLRCDNLTEVNGLSKAQMIKYWNSFSSTPWRDSLKLDDPFLVDEDGTLIAYAGDDSNVVIPDTVKIIGESAFAYNDNIKQVTIPDSVTKISSKAFAYCQGITEITIPASVTKLEEYAFSNCTQLKDVTLEASDTALEASSLSFQFTLISPDTLITNGRKFKNQSVVFQQTLFDPEYSPTAIYNSTEAPEATEAPTATPSPTAVSAPTPTAVPETEKKELTVISANENISVAVDGTQIIFDDAQPFIDENGRTQIPIRAVAEALGCAVDWDNASRTASITKDKTIIIIAIDNSNMQVGQKLVKMDTTAQIVNDRTYIPVRFVGEALGMEVIWQSE